MRYPQDWHTNDGSVLPACSAFDPEPFAVAESQDFADAAILLSVENVEFAAVVDPEAISGEVVDRRDAMVDGHDAVRIESSVPSEGEPGEATRSTQWLIVMGRERTLSLVTHELPGDSGYEEHREVLDRMVSLLTLPVDG